MTPERVPLMDYENALALVREHAVPLGVDEVPIDRLLGRVLAAPVRATYDLPVFDTSAMDGYALTIEDVREVERHGRVRLELVGTAPAGWNPTGAVLRPGSSLKILTGAAAPEGVAAVAMQEDVVADGATVTVTGPLSAGENIRRRGEEFRTGDEVVPAGTVVRPGVVAAIAASGQATASAYRRPRVGLLVTGDELVLPGAPLAPGRIYDSNSYGLTASLAALGFEPPAVLRADDDLAATRGALSQLLAECDVVLASGGVSVGEFDTVKPALAELGVETVLWGVAIKPGKPFYFGRLTSRTPAPAVFGLPGNPVSAMVTFHVLVRAYVLRTMGLCGRPATIHATLATGMRKKPGRMEFVPCHVTDARAEPVGRRGSHMLGTLVATNGLALFPKDLAAMEAGDEVDVMPLGGGIL